MLRNPLAWLIILGTIAALAGVGAVYWSFIPKGSANPNDPAQVAAGKTIYMAQCASCHGATLEGQQNWRVRRPDGKLPAPPHDASGHTWHHADPILFNITKRGPRALAGMQYKTDMLPYAGVLSDDEIWAALAYIKSTWPPVVLRRQEAANQQSR